MSVTTMAEHGATFRKVPTSVISPITATVGLNVPTGAAPVHILDDWDRFINRPIVCNSLAEFTEFFGYSSDWKSYPLCEHADSAFRMFGIRPVVYNNILNPGKHRAALAATTLTLAAGQVNTNNRRIIRKDLVVKTPPATEPEITYERGRDFLATYDNSLNLIITRLTGGRIPADNSQISISGFVVDPSLVDKDDIIGGVDIETGIPEGLEAIELVFAQTGLIPGILLAPGWSDDPEVAAVLETKNQNSNGGFMSRSVIDVADSIERPIDALAWKTANNIVSDRQDVGFLYIDLGERHYHFSSQWGPLQMWTDAVRGAGVPYVSPSNKPLKANGTSLADGTELILTRDQANGLNANGICTALNWGIYGWKGWGNRTAAGGGASPDIANVFIPNARMGDWIGNSFILTMTAYVDDPGNRRLIDLVVNSFNRWLNGLLWGPILGARVEFRHEENPTVDLMDGHYKFHTFYLSPPPAEWIENIIEVDVGYFEVLFEAA